ncbi:VENN motif pre-toxin domain-containing protein [Photorhabdus laumondii]|uniref:Photorhabdus luminescens subsp. laumondii TTO1 complete genome segment 2/17 n=1 Tax=Photorhabdus laumondii subsp. laumondii (strain DSM 15139 / CIP 105565 / TT01) TaxID=243265 RepID=Q7N915_PHOLL|nr:hypothetical protein A4R40_02665 [Photorhabdus laumondii subsp. laumondii]CAE12834.1 unnamed protein product [Photorhabdus laumondii subsp. laumondii TTO1]
MSISTGGSAGGMFLSNLAANTLGGANREGHAQSTTHAAVSDGTLIIRDKDHQQQDVTTLSRDTDHANNALSPIFDKEKEQQRLKQAQLIGEISAQVIDIASTEGAIIATKAANAKLENISDPDREAAIKVLKDKGKTDITPALIKDQIYKTAYNAALNESGLGTGGKYHSALQAATAAIQGLAGGNIGQALAGGASPYLAGVIKDLTTDPKTHQVDVVTNTLAHAILGAVAAEVSGNNALAGAAGGELAARELMKHIHGENAKVSDLSEEEKQTISTLSTLAAGLAGGIAGDSTGSAVTGAQAGKNAVENNFLKAGQITSWLEKYKASSTDEEKNRLIEVASKADQDQQQKAIETKISKDYLMKQQEELIKLIQSPNCDADCTKLTEYSLNQISPVIDNYDTLQKSNNIPRAVIATISLALPTLAKTATPAVTNWIGSTTIANRAIGVGTTGLANLGMQGYNIYNNPQENFSYTSFGTSLITGGATAGMGYWGTAATNTLGAGVSSVIDGNSPWLPMGGAFVGSSVGYGVTKGTTNYLDNKMNPWSNGFKERFNLINPSISAPPLVSPAPGIVGSAVGAVGSETANKVIMDELSSKDKK